MPRKSLEGRRQYYEEHKQENNARARLYRERHPEKVTKRSKDYRDKHKQQLAEQQAKWHQANPDIRQAARRSNYSRLRDEVIKAYGGYVCKCCGIDEPIVLTIDHVNNDGNAHRKSLNVKTKRGGPGSSGNLNLYRWLRDNGYPDGFQVLCMNCNFAKHRNGGVLLKSLIGRCNDYPVTGSTAKRPEARRNSINGVHDIV